MTDEEQKKSEKTKKDSQDPAHDILVFKSNDLREVVTETVTKLLAEDVLVMDDEGLIDVKKTDEQKKKKKEK